MNNSGLKSHLATNFKVSISAGFTLVELLVAISIVATIGLVVVISSVAAQKLARDGQRKSDLKKIQLALQQYYSDQGFYPNSAGMKVATSITDATGNPNIAIPTKTYLASVPQDPLTSTGGSFTNGFWYYYDGEISYQGGPNCDNSTVINQCHMYYLRTRLENLSVSSGCNGNSCYNYTVTPLAEGEGFYP